MAKRKPQLINVDPKSPAVLYQGEFIVQPPVVEDTGIFQSTYHPVTASDGKVLYRTSNAPDEYRQITTALLKSRSLNEFLGTILEQARASGLTDNGQRDYFEAIIGREHIEQNVQSGEIGKAIAAAIIFGKALQRLGVRPYETAVKSGKIHRTAVQQRAKTRTKNTKEFHADEVAFIRKLREDNPDGTQAEIARTAKGKRGMSISHWKRIWKLSE